MEVETAGRDRFWLRPKWVVGHVLVVALVVAFVNFGFWQLRRLDERRSANAVVEARSSMPAAPFAEVVPDTAGYADVEDDLAYRRVVVRGTYDAGASVLVRSRTLDGRPGFWVLTPLVVGDGSAVVVNRGFAPFATEASEVLAATRPPAGPVEVAGLVLATQERQGIGPTDPPGGVLDKISRVDLARLQQQYERPLAPGYVQLQTQDPPGADLPIALPDPEQSDGSHLSYAVQWFLFAAVGALGWPLLLRHTAAERDQHSRHPSANVVDVAVSGTADPTKNGRGRGPGAETAADREAVSPS
ncbi:MAG TPA: SURF1 family protein [Acidimicrobiales bacterium]|nr:SURF1 family protein [Acidimicrobiales bacterium]